MGKFSIVQPSLIQQLKSILDQYQDDGQILKELIQNAEDAQATEVKFLLDERSHTARPEFLHHPDLAQFQGPALYSYNDAYFTESDWTGLKMLGDSIKKDDPTKVGRFGLGFKSVFHITDLPSVLSGDRVCILDPHERYFVEDGRRTTGYSWHLKEDRDEVRAVVDQFAPYRDVFADGCDPLETGHFRGTLFRFPLRQRPSALSDSTYDARKVEEVFRAFETAAQQVLIFLTSVERVELHRRAGDISSSSSGSAVEAAQLLPPSPSRLLFRVQVAPSVAPAVREKRKQFVSRVREASAAAAAAARPSSAAASAADVSLTFQLTVESTVPSAAATSAVGGSPDAAAAAAVAAVVDADSVSTAVYLVSHYCRRGRRGESAHGSGGGSATAPALHQLADELGYLPWASAAALLPGDDAEPLDCMVPSGEPPRGQLFCFLPLPLQRDSPTGLPVHVSGFFALSSNRHQVKWPSTVGHGATDRACVWNQRLADEVVPRAYAALLVEAVAIVRGARLPGLTRRAVYGLFPDPDLVVDRWRRVLPVLFDVVFREPVVFVHANSGVGGGRWELAERTLAPDEHDDLLLRDVLARCLAAAASASATGLALVPAHVLKVARTFLSRSPQPATPGVVRQTLRRAPGAVRVLSDEECLVLLNFVLRDEQYDDLWGVPLLPVSDGTFVTFSADADAQPVYVPTEDHPSLLLPQIPKRFLDVSNRVDDVILNKLKFIAYKRKAQLRSFNEKVFASVLRSLLKTDDITRGFYGEIIWEYLHKYFSKDLSAFEGLPLLLALQASSSDYLALPLRSDHPVLALKFDEFVIGDQMATSALKRLDITLIDEASLFVCNHPHVRNTYLFQPTAQGILSILCVYAHSGKITADSFVKLTADEKRAVRGVLARLNRPELLPEQLRLLEAMPIFEVEGRHGVFTCAKQASVAAPLEHPPLPEACVLLDVRDTSSQFLADLLAVARPSRAQLFVDHLMPIIRDHRCSRHDVEAIMVDVLLNLAAYVRENSSVMSLLASLPFVSRQDGTSVTPSRVFDPESDVLHNLLYGQKLFPSPPYDGKEILVALRRLGLGNISTLDGQELVDSAYKLSELAKTIPRVARTVIINKSLAILAFLEEHHSVINGEHLEDLKECDWIVPLDTPVPGYPSHLPWFKADTTAVTPMVVVDISYVVAVGSSAPVLPRPVSGMLRHLFGWDALPDLHLVLRHLKNVVSGYRSKEKGNFLSIICNIYDVLQSYDCDEVLQGMQQHQVIKWVWHGDGFAPAHNIVLSPTSSDFKPYIFILPPEVEKYCSLFAKAGAHEACGGELLLDVLHMVKDKYASAVAHSDEAKQDLQLVLEIIEQLASSSSLLTSTLRSRLLVPVAVDGKHVVNLVPVDQCTYCESEWLNQRRLQISADEQERIIFVHPSVRNDLAERLGVPSLVNRMLNADKFEIGEGFGQSEPLTRRLRNLLQEYADGFAVPKELIQNADDAGATEVKFLYDERRNEDALTCLIDDGMRECQGPALWIYNNAVFTDDDFDSIIKLSGASKAHESEKIGGFGLGFNAVYNLTDVPSFVSRHYVVIFDPHTTHLGRGLTDPTKPGIKIDLEKNSKALRTLRNQFKPYNGIFGCELLPGQGRTMNFDGTLFRLPLRTADQAARSEISDIPYDREQIKQLFQLLARSCSSLLLFTQNVRSVSVHYVPQYGKPADAKELFSVTKEPMKIIRELKVPVKLPPVVKDLTEVEQEFTKQSSILKASASVMQLVRNGRWSQPLPQTSLLVRMQYKQTSDGCHFVPLPEGALEAGVPWLIVSCMGSDEALNLALAHNDLSPTGGVAVPLEGVEEGVIVPHQLLDDGGKFAGRVFCYLPLPIESGLPVHINGAFAVSSNRRHLLMRSVDDKQHGFGYWNESLMKDTIAKAYATLLEDIRDLQTAASSANTLSSDHACNRLGAPFYHVWPVAEVAATNCLPIVLSLYAQLAGGLQKAASGGASSSSSSHAVPTAPPRLFSDGHLWVDLNHAAFLDSELRLSQSIASAATQALQHLLAAGPVTEDLAVIDLPAAICEGFIRAGCSDILRKQSYDQARLYKTAVFPIIARLPDSVRDPLVLFALDHVGSAAGEDETDWLRELLATEACIPVSPDGRALSHAAGLVSPSGQLACLYPADEGRFPHGSSTTYLAPARLATLVGLGMLSSDLAADELLARASAAAGLCADGSKREREAACQRAAVLLKLIDKKIAGDASTLATIRPDIRRAQFLPFVAQLSGGSSLGWQGDAETSLLLSADAIFPSSAQSLLCFVEPVLDEAALATTVSDRVKEYLGLNRPVPMSSVLSQLRFIAMNEQSLLSTAVYQSTKKILHDVYQFLQVSCATVREDGDLQGIVDRIKDVGRLILVGTTLAHPEQVSSQPMHCDCSPYLFELPFELRKYEHMFRLVGMRDHFSEDDFVNALEAMKGEYSDKPLSKRDLQISLNLAGLLNAVLQMDGAEAGAVASGTASRPAGIPSASAMIGVYLPDSNSVLRLTSTLCFNDCPWLPDDKALHFVHSLVPYEIAKRLGVNTKRQETLRKVSSGIPFGQKEKLTKRLKRIMSVYPCGKEIFKELMQNADDAGATVVHFVRDCRSHPAEKVFEDCWKPLQGPALCVYNNRPFTKSDLEGIQNLGDGSKGRDPNKTGQYGVGFNSVYHLTDAPSFLTCGPEVGELLCVFDPHCYYVPGATPDEPGRMYNDVAELRRLFPDVFASYLESLFSIRDATIFRFPLRNADMAENSRISSQPVTIDAVGDLMNKFRSEMFDALLFINNVTEITISDIPKAGSWKTETYTVRARLSSEDAQKRREFSETVSTIGRQLKSGVLTLADIGSHEVCYSLELEDSAGYKEIWLVLQRIGFDNAANVVSPSLLAAFASGDMCLLPRGGVACLMHSHQAKGVSSQIPSVSPDRPRKAFCFLPLPIATKLPVHINSHFALDHEARRGLWKDDDGGPRTEWNTTLLEHIIAPAYLALLEAVRGRITATLLHNPEVPVVTTPMTLDQSLDHYHQLFPAINVPAPWDHLSRAVYRLMACTAQPVLPLVKEGFIRLTDVSRAYVDATVEWLPVSTARSASATYFNTIDDERMTQTLLACGLRLLRAPLDLCSYFEAAGVPVCRLGPADVTLFLLSQSCLLPGQLPCSIGSTAFGSVTMVRMLATYCRDGDPSFWLHLEGLPFGVTQDGGLRRLSADDKLFVSTHYDLVPDCLDLFLHSDLLANVFNSAPETPVFRKFTVEEFGMYIHQALPEELCCDKPAALSWYADQLALPNRCWLVKVWSFLAEHCMPLLTNAKTDLSIAATLEATLYALHRWALIPASTAPPTPPPLASATAGLSLVPSLYNRRLVPIKDSHAVVDLSLPVASAGTEQVRSALRRLSVLELDARILDEGSSGFGHQLLSPTSEAAAAVGSQRSRSVQPPSLQLLRLLTASLSKPAALLKAVKQAVDLMPEFDKKCIKQVDCDVILRYFSDALSSGQLQHSYVLSVPQCQQLLRDLPFYGAINGQCTDLGDKPVFLLPPTIPAADFDVWRAKANVVFLQKNDTLEPLYNFLGCQKLTDIEVYCQFIFEQFAQFSSEARIAHLTYIRDRLNVSPSSYSSSILKLPEVTDEERTLLLTRLRDLAFIDGGDGNLCTAGVYYDADNHLFQAMLDRTSFPPCPFDGFRWIRFLRLIGLRDKVSDDEFVSFAQRIAAEAKIKAEARLVEKSKILVRELFKRPNLATSGDLLKQLCQVPFISAADVNSHLHDICPQFGFENADSVFISFCGSVPESKENMRCSWSTAHFLPYWADPQQQKQADFEFEYPYNHPCGVFDNYRDEIVQQLGILVQPTVSQVVKHLKNLSNALPVAMGKWSADHLELVLDIMKTIYRHLQEHMPLPPAVRTELSSLPCIIVETGRGFVRAEQLVLNFYEEQQIKPYLQRAPPQLAEFHPFLRHLGATERATIGQFAAVLQQMYDENSDERLHPNILKACYKAVKGLVTILSQMEKCADINSLYLPSQDARLLPACELVYNDEPAYAERLQPTFDQPFLVDLRECHLQISYFGDVVRKLPSALRPRMLANIVEECLDERSGDNKLSHGPAQILRTRLSSSEFTAGILRLIRHEHLERGEKPDAASLKAVRKALKNIRVYGVEQLVTYLKYADKKIEGSEIDTECFVTKEMSKANEPCWAIYVQMAATITPELLVKVAEIVNKIAGGLLHNSIIYLHPMLMCNAYDIELTLDKLRIRQDHHTARMPTLLPPGSFVPLDLHHQLSEDIVDFEPGEYVGYELDDPVLKGQAGAATYIYAVVIEEVFDSKWFDLQSRQFYKKYRINVGDDKPPAVVPLIDLYRLRTQARRKTPAQAVAPAPEAGHLSLNETFNDAEDLTTTPQPSRPPSPTAEEPSNEPLESYNTNDDGYSTAAAEEAPAEVVSRAFNDVSPAMPEPHSDQQSADTATGGGAACDDSVVIPGATSSVAAEFTVVIHPPEAPAAEVSLSGSDVTDGTGHTPGGLPTRFAAFASAGGSSQEHRAPQQPAAAKLSGSTQAAPPPAADASAILNVEYPELTEESLARVTAIVEKQVRATFKLEDSQRSKVLKRIMLKFHPDKNVDKQELCTAVMQSIRSLLDDLEQGGFKAAKEDRADWWSEFLSRRAKTYGQQQRDYAQRASSTADKLGGGSRPGSSQTKGNSKFDKFKGAGALGRKNPQPAEARRWFKQAEADVKAAANDFDCVEPSYEWVCFKCHQAAEKAMKGALYTFDSRKNILTDLKLIAGGLFDTQVSATAKSLQDLVGPASTMCHPDSLAFPRVPHEMFSRETAEQAMLLSRRLLEYLRQVFLEPMERELRGEAPDTDYNDEGDNVESYEEMPNGTRQGCIQGNELILWPSMRNLND